MQPFCAILVFQNYTLGSNKSDEGACTSLGGGVVFGRQWVYKSGLVFDLFADPAYNSGRVKYTSGSGNNDEPAFGINGTGLRIGLAFRFGF